MEKEDGTDEILNYRNTRTDDEEEHYKVDIFDGITNTLEADLHNITVVQAKKNTRTDYEKDLYLDAIKIYK